MELKDAIRLIELALPEKVQHSQWADLGCGGGTFTIALAHLLGAGSTIYAIDKQKQVIHSLTDVKIEFVHADFSSDKLLLSNLDGIIMANALHYVADKTAFVKKVKRYLKSESLLIIVEYDTERANQWVPYPLSFDRLKNLFEAHGFRNALKIAEYNSIYSSDKMYSCVVKQ